MMQHDSMCGYPPMTELYMFILFLHPLSLEIKGNQMTTKAAEANQLYEMMFYKQKLKN